MTRSLTTAVKNELATDDIRPIHLITIGFGTPINITDCSFPLTSSSNASTVTIEPPLTTALADNSVVTYDNVPFTVYLTSDIQEFGVVGSDKDGNLLYSFQFDVEEAL